MALQECGLHMNRFYKELQAHGRPEFPCAGYASSYSERPGEDIPWHWHEELEIIHITQGALTVRIPSEEFLVEAGDTIVINGNILHYGIGAPTCDLRSLVFHPMLITGNDSSVYATRYMQPLLACSAFTGYLIKGAEHPEVAQWFLTAHDALASDEIGYEFVVRECLSRICLYPYRALLPQMNEANGSLSLDNLRVRRMLGYIHENYANDITLAQIAHEADISERECLRCFQKTIQQSPVQYLLQYRIMQGADLLVRNQSLSIQEAASLCGFDSQSNFSKIFKRFYHCTPREYRKARHPG